MRALALGFGLRTDDKTKNGPRSLDRRGYVFILS